MKNNVYYKLTKFNDVEENIIDSSQTYIRINKDKGDIDTFSIDLVWRIHYLEEVIMLLKNAGFDVLETINEYNQKTFEDSLFIQVVGKKVNNLKTDQIKVKELKPELTQCRIIQIEKEKKEHNKDDNKKGEKNEKSKV